MRNTCRFMWIPNPFSLALSVPVRIISSQGGLDAAIGTMMKPLPRILSKSMAFSAQMEVDAIFAPLISNDFGVNTHVQPGRMSLCRLQRSMNPSPTLKKKAASYMGRGSTFEYMQTQHVCSSTHVNGIPSSLRWARWAVLQVSSTFRATTPSTTATNMSPWLSPTI